MKLLARAHGELVFARRVRVLSEHLAALLPQDATVLDVGCGDGTMACAIGARRADVAITGLDVLVRPRTNIRVEHFDGSRLPRADDSVDTVMFVDVLHHTIDPQVLLGEARRVARRTIIIKDHTRDGFLAGATLRFMDWVGNAPHGVALPYNYWPLAQWRDAFSRLGITPSVWQNRLDLYGFPAGFLFDRSLHFIARLDVHPR